MDHVTKLKLNKKSKSQLRLSVHQRSKLAKKKKKKKHRIHPFQKLEEEDCSSHPLPPCATKKTKNNWYSAYLLCLTNFR